MSFISVVICDSFISVMADSRVVELYSNGNVHRVIDEDYDKITPLNNNVFVVFSGCNEDVQAFIDNSNLCEAILDNGKLRQEDELNRWFNSVSHYVVTNYSFRIHFGGLTKDNKLKAYQIASKTKDLKELVYQENHLSYDLSSLKDLEDNFIIGTFLELCNKYNGTVESMVKIQETLNDIIADNSGSVNKNKKKFIIKR